MLVLFAEAFRVFPVVGDDGVRRVRILRQVIVVKVVELQGEERHQEILVNLVVVALLLRFEVVINLLQKNTSTTLNNIKENF